ncbi:MAG: hypothetical protein V4582_14515 [Pseudomonadota bacterium]
MSKASVFAPYANEAQLLRVGGLQLENRLDRVTLSGELDLCADQAGLALARQLHGLLAAIVAELAARDLPPVLPAPPLRRVPNPFD